jgi:hypothetical protein
MLHLCATKRLRRNRGTLATEQKPRPVVTVSPLRSAESRGTSEGCCHSTWCRTARERMIH